MSCELVAATRTDDLSTLAKRSMPSCACREAEDLQRGPVRECCGEDCGDVTSLVSLEVVSLPVRA